MALVALAGKVGVLRREQRKALAADIVNALGKSLSKKK